MLSEIVKGKGNAYFIKLFSNNNFSLENVTNGGLEVAATDFVLED